VRMRFLPMADSAALIQVLFALPEEQTIVEFEFEPGMTAAGAVTRSGLIDSYPEIERSELILGIWGVEVAHDCLLQAGDRVEISRPLVADPRDMRRNFLSGGRVMGGANGPRIAVKKKVRE
jgi:uncharacterized protein